MWNKLKEQLNLLKLEKKRLLLITNSDKFTSKDEFLDAIASALQGGVEIILYRENEIPDSVKVELARKIRILCDEYGSTFIVNDRADIAQIAEADGVHLGQDDISIADAREILGENAIIGKTCENTDQVIDAMNDGADYVTFGPVEVSKHKNISSAESLSWMKENIEIPVFVFGEINTHNINELIQAGVERIAVDNSLMYAHIPEETARDLLKYLP